MTRDGGGGRRAGGGVPPGQSWFLDDIPADHVHVFGEARITADDVADFTARFAPFLPMRPEEPDADGPAPAPQALVYAIWTRLVWAETRDWPVLARLGQDALRWYRPARVGDVLRVRLSIVSKEAVGEDRGILIAQHEMIDQDGALVMALMTRTALARR